MFVLLSTAGECFELSSMLEFFFSSTCYLTKSTHSEQKTKCTHLSCSVESTLKSTFDLYSVLGGQFDSTTVPVLNRHRYPVATRYQVSVPGFHIMLLRFMFYSFGTSLKLTLWLSFYIESVFHTSGSFCKGPSTFASYMEYLLSGDDLVYQCNIGGTGYKKFIIKQGSCWCCNQLVTFAKGSVSNEIGN